MKSSSGWFMETLEEKKTEDLVNCLESVMLSALEDNPLITLENRVGGSGLFTLLMLDKEILLN